MIYVTHIRLSGGSRHEHISEVKWINPSTNNIGISTREGMVTWLRQPGTVAKVQGGGRTVDVRVVEATPPYIRTYADGTPTDNLLALPHF